MPRYSATPIDDLWNHRTLTEYGISLTDKTEQGSYGCVIVAVQHREYAVMSASDLRSYLKVDDVMYDLKGEALDEANLRLLAGSVV